MVSISAKRKNKNRYPMIFVGGIGISTTPDDLIEAFQSEGYSITIYPKIRQGNSFSYCPTVALATNEMVEELLFKGALWVKDRFVDIREYKIRSNDHVPKKLKSKKKHNQHNAMNRKHTSRDGSLEQFSKHRDVMPMDSSHYPHFFAPSPIPILAPSPMPIMSQGSMEFPVAPSPFIPIAPTPNMIMPAPSPHVMPLAPSPMHPGSPIPMLPRQCDITDPQCNSPVPVVVNMIGDKIVSVTPIPEIPPLSHV